MKQLCVAALVALVVGCHLDKLVGGSGGGSPPPSHGTPVALAFMTQPQTAQAGQPIGPVKVSIVDSVGHPVAGDTTTVAVTLGANPGGATLHGDTTAHPVNGVATFTNLWLDNAGTNYTLAASAGTLSGTSNPFDINPPPPTTGTLNVTTNTTANPPASGYTVSVSNAGSQSIGASQTVTFPGVSPGTHAVTLGNVPSTCTVAESNPQTVTITAGQPTSATFTITCTPPPPTTGDLTVTTSTTGSNLDPDGYTVTVDGSNSQAIGINSSTGVTFPGLSAGSHSVNLTGVASNCAVGGNNPRTVNVTAGTGGSTAFSVTCSAPPSGSITVTVTTNGPNPPSGYTITVDAGPSQSVAATGSVTFNNLSVATHSVGLSPIPSNCSVSPANSQTVSVTAGNTTQVSFTVTCSATTGDLVVTTTTGGSNLDPDGYTVSAAGTSKSILTNGSVTFSGVQAGTQNVALSGIATNCTVTNANPMSVSVPAGGTGHADFAITCTAPPDQPPVVNAGGNQTKLFGSVTLNASFSDPDNDAPWNVSIDWDDGSSPETFATSSQGSISRSHSYGLNLVGMHNVRVIVTDSHGLSGSDTAVITIVASLAPPGGH